MLKLKNVSKYYYQDGVIAEGFSKVNLELHIGEFVVITGESGSGKSTLLNVLSGLDTYEDGEMYINGEETSHYRDEEYIEYRRKYVSNIFQNFNLVNSYTVYENIELTLLMNGKSRKEVKSTINDLIEKVGLKKYKNTTVSKLSGGQKQRVAIARALANDTPIIVADEPTGSLDSKSSKEIIKLLSEISNDKLVIIVTHNKNEVEEYATRLIRMHDGKLLENKVIKEVNKDNELKEKEVKEITGYNKLKLGFRNAFNLPVKFILMFGIFLLISLALISEYGSLKKEELENSDFGDNYYFSDTSKYRIIIKKENKDSFNDSDYKKIEKLKNIDKIVKNDLTNDFTFTINSNEIYFNGKLAKGELNNVDKGRLPQNDYEVVIKGNKSNWYLGENFEDVLNSTYSIDGIGNNNYDNKIKIVGIIYNEEDNYSENTEIYLGSKIKEDILSSVNASFKRIKIELNDNYFYPEFYDNYLNLNVSDKLKENETFISEDLNMYCKDYNCLNQSIKVSSSDIYENNSVNLKIIKVYNKNNFKEITSSKYDNYNNTIFISKEDYNKLFNNKNYQSSVYVKKLNELDKTKKELNDLGYETLLLRDAKSNEGKTAVQILKIFKLVLMIGLIFTLFFISYFIIKIIYKSRNSYYTTIRTLGGTKKVCINILRKELITLATFTYGLLMVFILLVKQKVINIEYFVNITKYVTIKEYILVYLILLFLSTIISFRYGRKIFKESIIKTYGERV